MNPDAASRDAAPVSYTRDFVTAPEPELWRKEDGYSRGIYDWAIVGPQGIAWFDSEDEARAAFDQEVGR